MTSDTNANPSLWWKLSWQLSLVFVAVVAAVIVGLCVYGAMTLSPVTGFKDRIIATLNESLTRDPQGRLAISESPHLQAFKAEDDRLWFVVSTADNSVVSYGTVPAVYAGLSFYVHLIKDADIRGAAETMDVASVDTVETDFGTLRVMYGGNGNRNTTFLTLLTYTYPLYVSLLAIALPAVFLTVPRIVRRALSGLSSVVRSAPEIDPRRSGARLPVEKVPKEVVPLIVAFNSILERLEDQFKARQRFLVDAAHELRTPIAIMQTRIEGMAEGRERRRLMDDVARLRETAEQLLDFERNDQSTELHKTIDLVEIARKVVMDLAPLAIAAGYEISFEHEVDKLEREGSATALPRAISNLVRNAIDHGGHTGAISVSVFADRRIEVSDEGPGIPVDQREQIFEPFYRVMPRSTGAGLGLSLVKQIVSNHDGRISVRSGSPGTIFTIQM
ncbi:HAMP domain-containing histidine kinase [Agrobacterium rhizogenes]|nr:HAMP domain-containing histidine kinase [Rhizobium rhizogenes]